MRFIKLNSAKAERWVFQFAKIFAALLLVWKGRKLLFYPTLNMDEAYYLAAAQAVSGGDLLLSTQGFDKPILLAYWPVLGLLSFGLTPLGIRIVGLACYLGSFFVLTDLFKRLSGRAALSLLIVFGFYSLPLMIAHGVSAMSEPYLVLMMSIFLNQVTLKSVNKKLIHVFWIGFLTKFSMIFCLPSAYFQLSQVKDWWPKTIQAIKMSRFWIVVLALTSLINPEKFASILWFKGLSPGGGGSASLGPASALMGWGAQLYQALSGGAYAVLILLAVFGFGAYSIRSLSKNRNLSVWVKIFLFPTLLQLVVILVAGSAGYDRYLITLWPGLMGCVLGALDLIKAHKLARYFNFLLLFGIMGFAAKAYVMDANAGLGNPELGRQLMVIDQEYNRPGVIIHTDFLWQTRPYARKMIVSGCTSEDCLKQHWIGVADQKDQFVLKATQMSPGFAFERVSLGANQTKSQIISIAGDTLAQRVLSALRLGKAATDLRATFNEQREFNLAFRVRGRALLVKGRLFVNDWSEYPGITNQRRNTLVAEILGFEVEGHDWTDVVMPLFYRGYAIRLQPLDVKPGTRPDQLELSII